jgi:hypothetical protein
MPSPDDQLFVSQEDLWNNACLNWCQYAKPKDPEGKLVLESRGIFVSMLAGFWMAVKRPSKSARTNTGSSLSELRGPGRRRVHGSADLVHQLAMKKIRLPSSVLPSG